MTCVRVPSELLVALDAPFARRGLVATTNPSAPVAATLATLPPVDGPWLALVGDDYAAAAALDVGADDVVTPTTSATLIAARAAHVLRRRLLRVGELEIDPLARTARRSGRALALLPREYALLAQLARQPNRTVGRDALRLAVLGRGFDPGTNALEVHVSRLRAELDRATWPMLLTERGRGYRLVTAPVVAEHRPAS